MGGSQAAGIVSLLAVKRNLKYEFEVLRMDDLDDGGDSLVLRGDEEWRSDIHSLVDFQLEHNLSEKRSSFGRRWSQVGFFALNCAWKRECISPMMFSVGWVYERVSHGDRVLSLNAYQGPVLCRCYGNAFSLYQTHGLVLFPS